MGAAGAAPGPPPEPRRATQPAGRFPLVSAGREEAAMSLLSALLPLLAVYRAGIAAILRQLGRRRRCPPPAGEHRARTPRRRPQRGAG